MINFYDNRYLPIKHFLHHTNCAKSRRNRTTTCLDCELKYICWIEVERIFCKWSIRRMLDALINRKDREISSIGESSMTVEFSEVCEHSFWSIRLLKWSMYKISSWKNEHIFIYFWSEISQQGFCFCSEKLLYVRHRKLLMKVCGKYTLSFLKARDSDYFFSCMNV